MKILNILALIFFFGCKTLEETQSLPAVESKRPQNAVHCKETKMIGWRNPEDMTPMDRLSYQSAKKRCPEKFLKSPCLTEFQRLSENNYRATCGAALEDNNP